jgi:hypothetical protein
MSYFYEKISHRLLNTSILQPLPSVQYRTEGRLIFGSLNSTAVRRNAAKLWTKTYFAPQSLSRRYWEWIDKEGISYLTILVLSLPYLQTSHSYVKYTNNTLHAAAFLNTDLPTALLLK